jgi:hypothetical protein
MRHHAFSKRVQKDGCIAPSQDKLMIVAVWSAVYCRAIGGRATRVVRRSLASTSGGKGLDADGDYPGSSATAARIFRRCPSKTPMSLRS